MRNFPPSLKYINLQNFKNDKAIGSAFNQAKDIVVCQKEKIITNRKVYYCCDYNFETKECETIPTTIISTIPTFIPEISNINAEKSDTQDINAYTQNSKDLIYLSINRFPFPYKYSPEFNPVY